MAQVLRHCDTIGDNQSYNVSRICVSQVVIPARIGSTRLPRKPLLRETGKSLIQHVYEAARRARHPSGVCVATDDREIFEEVISFGGRAVMTSAAAASGTDRVAEVASEMSGIDIIVNMQGDEPELPGDAIDKVVGLLVANPDAVMSTLAAPIRNRRQLEDLACVKVVFDHRGHALYFSRSPIPCARSWNDNLLTINPPVFWQHIGLYAYRREFLLALTAMPQSSCEQIELLEQVRVLHNGYDILVGTVDKGTSGIDTPEDYLEFVKRHRRCRDSGAHSEILE
jgi:3-deoxy-manno-octulosonate cytidylyltransferase (CMP-KDO synthetase)